MAYNPRDYYFRKAKERHFVARSVFKLEELDRRFHILRAGFKVLDLGCAPGSWSQYASQIVGPNGFVLGIDRQKVNLTLPNAKFIQADILSDTVEEKDFNVVMSDMAPKTTGIRIHDQQLSYQLCLAALEIAKTSLKKGGKFVIKFFHSEEFSKLLDELKPVFEKIEILRPKSTRKESKEIYIIGISKK